MFYDFIILFWNVYNRCILRRTVKIKKKVIIKKNWRNLV